MPTSKVELIPEAVADFKRLDGRLNRVVKKGKVNMAKTARELSREELRSYRPWLSMERHRQDREVSKRWVDAWKVARIVAEMLKKRFGATRVVVFGSVARKTVFTPWSDIDLAVWGIAPEDYYSAAGVAMDIGLEKGVRVDVVDPEDCDPRFLVAIEQEGTDL